VSNDFEIVKNLFDKNMSSNKDKDGGMKKLRIPL